MARTLGFSRAMWFAAVTFAVACSEEPRGEGDSGASRSDAGGDVSNTDSPPDDTGSDATAADASLDFTVGDAAGDARSDEAAADGDARSDEAAADGDARSGEAAADGDDACTCTLVDSGVPPPFQYRGVMSLPCYCVMPWPGVPGAPACASYEVATRCDGARKDFFVETYTNCNLITVSYGIGGGVQDVRVYDHTTHELVGASRGTDYTIPCGTSLALTISYGVVPGPECQTAKVEWPCLDAGRADGDAGDAAPRDDAADASLRDDADGGCTCEPDERHEGGLMSSLACYCAPGGCLAYDEALTSCTADSPPAVNRVEDYEACNLVVMTFGRTIPGGGVLVYDRTTHELVGASSGADYPAFQCGDASVFGYRAGTFPPAGCAVSRSVPRCPGDGG